ncbi:MULTISPECIES: hypothetical protein [Terrabacteria group]|uniref:hypothetical protein n=1 Tax=Bacillati TaxID=1783272 RepID=UPI001C6EB66C|nr:MULTISPECIES: hypothetical protein [Terrabacteria group]MBW9213014.1 hypothetical protein [Trueperella sp. zg.1013]
MYKKIINNTSKGFSQKIFGKNHIEKIALIEDGFVVFMGKGEDIKLYFGDIKAVKSNFYLDKITPYRVITILTSNQKEYSLQISPSREEIDSVPKHYANYQLGGDIPEDINAVDVVLQYGLNDYKIQLKNGNLIETKRGQDSLYPLNTIEYYRIDKPSNTINIKFKEKKTFITLSAIQVTNVWLVIQILEKIAKNKIG